MPVETPRPSDNLIPKASLNADLSRDLLIQTRNSGVKKAGIATTFVMAAAATWGSFGERPTNAQTTDSSPLPSPIVSMEPGVSFEPNASIEPTDPCASPVPSPELLSPSPSLSTEPSFTPESPAPSLFSSELPDPSCAPEVLPIPSASPNTSEAQVPSGPAQDSFQAVLESKIDKKLKISNVLAVVNKLYKNKEYKNHLKGLHASYDDNTPINKEYIIQFINKCDDEKVRAAKLGVCVGNVTDFVMYARQFPLDSGDPIDTALNGAFANAAKIMRSAAVNDGVPLKPFDESIKTNGEYFDSLLLDPQA